MIISNVADSRFCFKEFQFFHVRIPLNIEGIINEYETPLYPKTETILFPFILSDFMLYTRSVPCYVFYT